MFLRLTFLLAILPGSYCKRDKIMFSKNIIMRMRKIKEGFCTREQDVDTYSSPDNVQRSIIAEYCTFENLHGNKTTRRCSSGCCTDECCEEDSSVGVYVGGSAGGGSMLVLLICYYYCCCRNNDPVVAVVI